MNLTFFKECLFYCNVISRQNGVEVPQDSLHVGRNLELELKDMKFRLSSLIVTKFSPFISLIRNISIKSNLYIHT